MSPPLKIGDKVRTATALAVSHWTQNELACRRPGAEGVIDLVQVAPHPEMYVACGQCIEHGCYIVEHNLGNRAHYHGDELTLVTKAEPEPDDEPDGGRLGERVEVLQSAIDALASMAQEQLDALRGRVAALEQPPAPEPVDPSANDALAKARPWCECTWIARDSVTSWLVDNGQQRSAPEQWIQDEAAAALEAVPDLVRALNKRPSPEPVDPSAAVDAADGWWCRQLADALRLPVADGNELLHRLRARLGTYRGLHRAAADWRLYADDDDATDGESMERGLRAALHVLDQLGVTPDKPPAAVHDDSSLDPARCERCGILTQMLDETTNTLFGIRQELLDAVDGEPEATTDELLARVLRRAGPMQRFIVTRSPKLLRKTADGLMFFAGEDGFVATVVALIREAATIIEEEQD